MMRGTPSAVFAALLLVVQLLSGVTSGATVARDGARHCDGCPISHSIGMSHDMGPGETVPDTDHAGMHCGQHCSHEGTTHTGTPACGSRCAMAGGGHCGSATNPALIPTASISPVVLTGAFGNDRRSVELPDSPLFDLLRPPTSA